MTASTWFALLGACLLISLTPGAGAINTMNNALNVGFRRSIWGILGQQLALLIQLVIVALGLGLVIAKSPTAFAVIRYVGAAYLIYLGIQQIRARTETDDDSPRSTVDESAWSMFTRGVWVNLLNPKAIVFLVAFIPGFVRTEHDIATQYAQIGVTIVVVDVLIMWLFFALVGRAFRRLTSTARGRRRLNLLFGVLFIGVGLMLVFM
ncbi:LysE family transporter [Gordonia sp. (in: high G+C Gram-positive bacteria)]|uniref:LysE family transporter n=1 Tax=Gordonia sp. (in: high G+C Gram-positive bacteria) TaxID=84139 RepID=UPI00169A0CC6|nr:LysE family transporter [Gordonia sp. (in: high G+C Gram-positive bacteria)]NLG46325.1 LysE family transporter [Gordonia sp. (in: high G+C Gram-positive bacteria)]